MLNDPIERVSQTELPNQSEVYCTFGNHDYAVIPEIILTDIVRFGGFMRSPYSEWDPRTMEDVTKIGSTVFCIDGGGSSIGVAKENPYNLRSYLVSQCAFMGSNPETDLVLADPFFESKLAVAQNTLDHLRVIENSYEQAHTGEATSAYLLDKARVIAVTCIVTEVFRRLWIGMTSKEKAPLIPRRSFLIYLLSGMAGVHLGFGGSLLADLITGKIQLSKDLDSVTTKIVNCLDPHIHIRPFTDGRTALMYAASAAYSERMGTSVHMVLGNAHRHFSDQIAGNRAYRVDRIRDLYNSYVGLIGEISRISGLPLSPSETAKIAGELLTEIDVAHIRKPLDSEIEECFEHPDRFVQMRPLGEIPDVTEALQA